jgi:pimeloyl-ACP methyl ester carboxylesterase
MIQGMADGAPLSRPIPDRYRDAPWKDTWQRRECVSQDGTRITYFVVGSGERTILLANGLGGRLYAWGPLLDHFWRDYQLITWDYRGLFDSDTPRIPRRLQVTHHVEDAAAILAAEETDRAVLCGWSMGVQVSLDVAASHADRVAGLVLLNGTYGHTMSSGFQPFFPMPALPKRLHFLAELARKRPVVSKMAGTVGRMMEGPTALMFLATAGPKALSLRPMLAAYREDVLGDSFDNFMRLFQELDAHSVYHLLPEIDVPALVISGALDLLTPARQSREIARRMPHAHRMALWRASHFALLERPEVVLPAVERFLEREARW